MNIRLRLLLLVFTVWLVAAASFALLAHSIYQQESAAERGRVREFGRTLSLMIERELDKRAVMARTLGASASLRHDDLRSFYDEAAAAARGTDSWVLLVTPTHELINTRLPWQADLRIPRPPGAPMVSGEPDVFFTPYGPVAHGPAAALFGPELGVTPPRYNVGIAFDPRVIQGLLQQQAVPDTALVSVVNDDQVIMARTRDPDKWIGRSAGPVIKERVQRGLEGFLASRTLDGVDSLTYISAPNRYRWTVIVATPTQTLARAAKALTLQAVAAASVLLFIGLGLVLYVSRRIGQPVELLRQAALALREERIPPAPRTGIAELDDIGVALHEAGLRSHDSTRLLEERVLEAVRRAEDAQAKLLDAQKHEAIGRLTGGLAHDFNNLLQTIRTALQVVELARPGPAPERVLDSAVRATNRAADLVRQMLAFGRRRPQQLAAVNFADFLLGARELVQKAMGRGIELVAEVAPDLPHVLCDPAQLELALLNLVFNARDALPEGGRVTVSARRLDEERVVIAVADDGEGMDEQTLARAAEPYFTTKPIGAGSGLGLAQVRAFALQCGGDMRIESVAGQGTRVTLVLPVAPAPAAAPAGEAEAHETRPLRILMVEDDLLVQSVVVPALEASGHAVTLAATADAAAQLLAQASPFDVVFTDVVMPGKMSGMDLAAWCRAHRPELPVLVATGYSAQAAGDLEVLAKPYDLQTLLEALARTFARLRAGGA